MSASVIESISPLAADLRSENPDCYLATLFAPVGDRRSLIALYALDNELARIQRVVREPMAGLIRLQWWDEIIDGFEREKSVAHPVVTELKRAVNEDGLDASYLKCAIDGRRRPFEEDQPPDQVSFEHYLVNVGGSVTSAAAALLGMTDTVSLTVAKRVGAAKAALEQVTVFEQAGTEQHLWLPSGWLDGSDRERQRPTGGGHSSNHPIIIQLAELGLTELAKGRAEQAPIKRHQLSAFFPATLAGIRLKNCLHKGRQRRPANAALTLALSWLRGRF